MKNVVEQKLKERHLDPSKYHVSWDDEVASFLLFNLSGQIVGYQNYRWNATKKKDNDPRESRYYTHVSKAGRTVEVDNECVFVNEKRRFFAVWGLETFNYRNDVLFVLEGTFDAVRLHNLGLPAIAALSNDPKQMKSWLRTLNRHVIMVCDGDKAGRKLAKLGDEAIILEDGRDLGDMTNDEVRKVVEKWV